MSGWVFARGIPRSDPVPQRYLDRLAERKRTLDVTIPMAIGWSLVDDAFYVHDSEGTTTANRLVYHVDRSGVVTVHGTPVDEPAPAGLTWRTPDASATAETSMLPGIPIVRE